MLMALTAEDMIANYSRRVEDNFRRLGLAPSLGAEAIHSFRERITTLNGIDRINCYLNMCGSHERAFELWRAIEGETTETFWRVILTHLTTCDSINPRWLHQCLLEDIRKHRNATPAYDFMNSDDRAFLDRLPNPVRVFRGCDRRKVRRMPWTSDRKIAEYFACGGRFSAPHSPVIATAQINKADIFFATISRKESEVVLDPHSVCRLRLDSLASTET